MAKPVVIRFEGPEEWDIERENVNNILVKYTGTSEYPSTKSFPPIILGAELDEDAVQELRDLNGVLVEHPDEDEN
ncbi:uncharacterized protein N7469_007108 [Penicillium citrinum]|uniref:Uncharacterized protein n=2 Tax=Penicillium TaxID=5073 RepID=A0A9W9TLB9_PENCI|nr:uncharacterized protein N7469_007108 [Penicillium citrinum]KAJ5227102.1 hypothetical protein N7469_007108 [Penicillium citrinum]KAJ5568435.1 hypothetical protein N7450_010921 [Penicillium hetheringtonii]